MDKYGVFYRVPPRILSGGIRRRACSTAEAPATPVVPYPRLTLADLANVILLAVWVCCALAVVLLLAALNAILLFAPREPVLDLGDELCPDCLETIYDCRCQGPDA